MQRGDTIAIEASGKIRQETVTGGLTGSWPASRLRLNPYVK
jgi:hypothetical protein